MERFKRAYAAFEDYLSGGLLFTGLSLIMINVILRYVWKRPQSILDEFSVYLIVWGILLGLGVALRNDHHIKVDMLFNVLPPRVKWLVSIFATSLGLAFCSLYTFYGYKLVNSYLVSGQRSSDSQFPLWIVNLVIPVSGVMFGARFVEKLFYIIKNSGRESLDAVEKGGEASGDGNTI